MEKNGLGKRINAVRKDQGLTADRLSEMCNINATYLRQIDVGLCIRGKPQFHQFFVGDIIKSEKVGTRLLDGRAVSTQGI